MICGIWINIMPTWYTDKVGWFSVFIFFMILNVYLFFSTRYFTTIQSICIYFIMASTIVSPSISHDRIILFPFSFTWYNNFIHELIQNFAVASRCFGKWNGGFLVSNWQKFECIFINVFVMSVFNLSAWNEVFHLVQLYAMC